MNAFAFEGTKSLSEFFAVSLSTHSPSNNSLCFLKNS